MNLQFICLEIRQLPCPVVVLITLSPAVVSITVCVLQSLIVVLNHTVCAQELVVYCYSYNQDSRSLDGEWITLVVTINMSYVYIHRSTSNVDWDVYVCGSMHSCGPGMCTWLTGSVALTAF